MKTSFYLSVIFIWTMLLLAAGCSNGDDPDPAPIDPAGNKKQPIANAGADLRIYLPVDSVKLVGSGTDADGTIAKYEWAKLSGPASYNLINSTAAEAKVKNLIEGDYAFTLKVTDNDGLSDADTVLVIVGPPCNCAPDCDPIGDPCNPWDY
ncbi:PKD domain-containing protein [Pontibacter fetidus]|uniref:PKD/Chitinase domain-containing protein n=1 Tax=Pontibacter fetidus TaxID=2700082 RepID=A0A6B2H503_9BACT|nr:hypothetical protein [Pontibacter fetidus]NDK55407.1 hypothetical protein [Pontibacter fetidus]